MKNIVDNDGSKASEVSSEGALRIWWIPKLNSDPFHAKVASTEEAMKVLNLLGEVDEYLISLRMKGEISAFCGLEVVEDGEWLEWEDPNSGDTISDIMRGAYDGLEALEPS